LGDLPHLLTLRDSSVWLSDPDRQKQLAALARQSRNLPLCDNCFYYYVEDHFDDAGLPAPFYDSLELTPLATAPCGPRCFCALCDDVFTNTQFDGDYPNDVTTFANNHGGDCHDYCHHCSASDSDFWHTFFIFATSYDSPWLCQSCANQHDVPIAQCTGPRCPYCDYYDRRFNYDSDDD